MATDPQITGIVQALEAFSEKAVTVITLDVTANLIETTPVDTGWARANWLPAIGSPNIKNLEGIQPDATSAAAAGATQASATAGITRYRLAMGKTFVTNNVPYILKLNDGSSRQAPSGFIQNAIGKALQAVERKL